MKASQEILSPNIWTKPVSIIWGLKDRWLDFNGVEAFAKSVNARLVQLSEVNPLQSHWFYACHSEYFELDYVEHSSVVLLKKKNLSLFTCVMVWIKLYFVHINYMQRNYSPVLPQCILICIILQWCFRLATMRKRTTEKRWGKL